MGDSIEEGKIFCKTLSNSLKLFQDREKCWRLNKKFFTEEKEVDLDLLYFGEEFFSCLAKNNYPLNKALEEIARTKNILGKPLSEIGKEEFDFMYGFFRKYGILVSSTLSRN